MKMAYLIVFLVLAASVAVYLYQKRNKSVATEQSEKQTKSNPYMDLRHMALDNKPSDIGLALTPGKLVVYGVVMDLGMGEGTATIVAYQTGDASLYISTGGGLIGAGKHKNVSDAAKQFVSLAQGFLTRAVKADVTPLPISGQVKFYLLTNEGIEVIDETIKNFENNTSPFTPLFTEGNVLLYQLQTRMSN